MGNVNENSPFSLVSPWASNFVLEKSSTVTLTIYNALGQKVTELANGQMSVGTHSVNFNVAGLSSGTYFYEMKANGQNLVRKMNLLK